MGVRALHLAIAGLVVGAGGVTITAPAPTTRAVESMFSAPDPAPAPSHTRASVPTRAPSTPAHPMSGVTPRIARHAFGERSAVASAAFAVDTPTAASDAARSAVRMAPAAAFEPEAFGRSGALRATFALPGESVRLPVTWDSPPAGEVAYRWVPVLGTPDEAAGSARPYAADAGFETPDAAGVYELELEADGARTRLDAIRLVVQVPFAAKSDGRIRGYRIGRYPTEGSGRTDSYAPPQGFVEVTPRNESLRLSDHFRIREFLTHDQPDAWPKYVVVDARLLEKLELVLDELSGDGIAADRMHVMSGFRTPQYNARGLGLGRARLSRHQFGDAADVWVDHDADGYMDDLNGDGRRDTRDARVMLRAVERIESRYPELLGGAGVYPDNGAHGPFIHIDVRGHRARW